MELYQFYLRDVVTDNFFKWISESKFTMKLMVFDWLLLSNMLNTKNMVCRRHYVVAPDTQRPGDFILCQQQCEEMLEHVYLILDLFRKEMSSSLSRSTKTVGIHSIYPGVWGSTCLNGYRMLRETRPNPCSWNLRCHGMVDLEGAEQIFIPKDHLLHTC